MTIKSEKMEMENQYQYNLLDFGFKIVIKSPKAYPAPPGSYKDGNFKCRNCKHYCRIKNDGKSYLKCGVIEHRWTHGPGTDIKASSPACKYFVMQEKVFNRKKLQQLENLNDLYRFRFD